MFGGKAICQNEENGIQTLDVVTDLSKKISLNVNVRMMDAKSFKLQRAPSERAPT